MANGAANVVADVVDIGAADSMGGATALALAGLSFCTGLSLTSTGRAWGTGSKSCMRTPLVTDWVWSTWLRNIKESAPTLLAKSIFSACWGVTSCR